MSEQQLPPGWAWAKVEALVDSYQNGCGIRRSSEGTPTVVLRLADVDSLGGAIAGNGLREIQLTDADRAKYALREGDLLAYRVNGSRSIAGRVVPYHGPEGLAFCDHFIRVRLHGAVDANYIALAFRSSSVRAQVEQNLVSSAGQHTIPQATLSQVRIPLPPHPEQRRIVAKLDELLASIRRAKDALDAVPLLLERFRQSLLAAAFRGDLTREWRERFPGENSDQLLASLAAERERLWRESGGASGRASGRSYVAPVSPSLEERPEIPASWKWLSLEAVTHPTRLVRYGILMPGPEHPGGVRYIKVKHMRGDVIAEDELPRTSPAIHEQYRGASLAKGDLLLAIRGTYGRVAIVSDALEGANITQDSARIAPLPGINRHFLAWMLRSPWVQNHFEAIAKGVAVQGLNISDLRPMPIPVPPRQEQDAIVTLIEQSLIPMDAIRQASDPARDRLPALENTILASAFKGALVPQDPYDEPASALLERIRKEREAADAASAAAPKGRKVVGAGRTARNAD